MEYIYAVMLLHKAGKEVSEANVKAVLDAAGVASDAGRIKAVLAALKDVNIDDAIAAAAAAPVASAPAASADAPAAEKKEEKKKDEGKSAEEAAAGLGALFG